MPKLNEYELRMVKNQKDLIEGNINRMCTADTRDEANRMFLYGVRRMLRILDCAEDAFRREDEEKPFV